MSHNLSIDIETFSSVPIQKAGAFKYALSPDFEILLIAYSLDNAPVEIIDVANHEPIPEWFITALKSPDFIKHAYNAAFEWFCLSQKFCAKGELLPVEQWRDTMLHGLYCGYPAGLDAISSALKLPEDKRKLKVGKLCIDYFCKPCDAKKTLGFSSRRLPEHYPDEWEQFKKYCKGDVVTEMAIAERLQAFPVPDDVQRQWQTDLKINARGVAVDMDLVHGALTIDNQSREKLLREAMALTGLDNPNSVSQLRDWLVRKMGTDIDKLNKEDIAALLRESAGNETIKRVLELRLELGKASVKKYSAIETAVCDDNRLRGMLQFYGANRSGRWAGRIVQLQNLYRASMSSELTEIARNVAKQGNLENMQILFGNVTETLAQLIRTAFVASEGHTLVDADFSAIEARVISWLAGEQWRLDVFRTHGKIYEASASQMFNVPLERITKGNPEYALRQKGKVAELALGYQGGARALEAMGALKMGIDAKELPDIVGRWRGANPNIVNLWYNCEMAAIAAIENRTSVTIKNLVFGFEEFAGMSFLTIELPSGRELFYAEPEITIDDKKRKHINFYGTNQANKTWSKLETFGGKIVENCIQAIARDCLAVAIERLEAAGYPIVFHVHDEIVIDCPEESANLDEVIKIMTEPIPWAQDLPLNANGWTGEFFRKE